MDTPKPVLSEELLEKARVELNEAQSEVPEQIKSFREKILQDPKKNFRTDDAFLLRFLRARKFNQKRALELITNYHKQREKYPSLTGRSCSELETAFSSNFHGVLPSRDKNGCAIVVLNSAWRWDPGKVSLEDLCAHFGLSLERMIEDADVQICGMVVVADMKGASLKHLISLNPIEFKRAVTCFMNSFPVRYKAAHIINQPAAFSAFFLMLKPFLSKKILSRYHFHGTKLEELHKHFDLDVLPEEFGGRAGPYDNSQWNTFLKQHEKTQFGFLT